MKNPEPQITYSFSKRGYMIYANGKPLGGAAISGPGPRGGQVRANMKMFQENAASVAQQIREGHVPAHMKEAYDRIVNE